MDETEDNDKAGPADIAASGGVHDLACTPTAAGKTQTADSIVDGMPEAARFLREKAAGALAMEEARAKTMAEVSRQRYRFIHSAALKLAFEGRCFH